MVVRNEGSKFLNKVLQKHKNYIDSAVIIDDGNTDDSIEICKSVLRNVRLTIVNNNVSRFSNEVELRKQQWQITIQEDPNWILNLDADEMFEDKFEEEIHHLLKLKQYTTMCFPLYDMWDADHYREDEYWFAHKTYRPFITRYFPEMNYEWLNEKQHCDVYQKIYWKLVKI
ncbi:glycosyltransferase family 2 protein [Paenibacillus polymyxa]|uniref:glycosyltransferase family 2 protein n=1 Tax=Paenibacillus polymyxa TaxID=1406 RepID=UPI0023798CD5|nr:glycosyltransferase family 2 protein [Paenibacillus polymyxa]